MYWWYDFQEYFDSDTDSSSEDDEPEYYFEEPGQVQDAAAGEVQGKKKEEITCNYRTTVNILFFFWPL